jgi:DNA repair protein RecO (recombination protein O)
VKLYNDRGVVLRSIKLGEADKIVTLVTEGRGKVRAVAKGLRKTKSRFGGRLEPMTHVSVQMYEGRELDTITQVETIDNFRVIRDDLDRVAHAQALLEVVDQLAQERQANPRLYQMLVGALKTMAVGDSALLVPAFFWKLLALEGYQPLLDECASCGATEDLVAFDLEEGGVLCRSDRRGAPISTEAIVLMRRILGGELAGALTEPAGSATQEVATLATAALEHHLERRLKSLGTLL